MGRPYPDAVALHSVAPVPLASLDLLGSLDRHQVAADEVQVQPIPVHACCHQLILPLGPGHLGWHSLELQQMPGVGGCSGGRGVLGCIVEQQTAGTSVQ